MANLISHSKFALDCSFSWHLFDVHFLFSSLIFVLFSPSTAHIYLFVNKTLIVALTIMAR